MRDVVAYGPRFCRGKMQYRSRHEAKVAMRKHPALRADHDLDIYACPYCSFHHVGHNRRVA